MNVAPYQKKEKNGRRRGARERQEKREDRRLISKKLRAALLRLFREQHGKKVDFVCGECLE